MTTLSITTRTATLLVALIPSIAFAANSEEASANLSLSGGSDEGIDADANADAPASPEADASGDSSAIADTDAPAGDSQEPWIRRYAPTNGMVELGVFGGMFFPVSDIELYEPDGSLLNEGSRPFGRPALDLGVRLGYYPSRFLGLEAEGAFLPFKTDGGSANGFAFRGHAIAQLAKWSITPFVVAGVGALGVSSPRAVVGKDTDTVYYFGGGLKFYFNRHVALRLDVRDVLTRRAMIDDRQSASNLEALLGLSFTFGRPKPPAPVSDTDGDGINDDTDKCPAQAGVAPDGCPIPDTDGDGINDANDQCPQEAGVEPDGCPIGDRDGDGVDDNADECPDTAGTEANGCPPPDSDNDGILDADDKCPQEPETVNHFEDKDGCPDEVPEEIKKFSGVIKGITFASNTAQIKKSSMSQLNGALDVLKQYPDLRMEISGHSDSTGKHEYNMNLSRERAEAVKTWLVEKGIASDRLKTEGFGPDKPIDTNDTKAGRSLNRRIEFRLLD